MDFYIVVSTSFSMCLPHILHVLLMLQVLFIGIIFMSAPTVSFFLQVTLNFPASPVMRALPIDCPRSGPGPCRPGSGLDQPHWSECLGQWRVDQTHFCEVQVQVVSGPCLGVGPGLDLDQAYFLVVPTGISILKL